MIESFVGLYYAVVEYGGDYLHRDVLLPALPDLQKLMAPLQPLRSLKTAPPLSVADEISYELFALGVVNDHLRMPLKLAAGEYKEFFEALGFEHYEPAQFSPMTCEIVGVSNAAKPESGIELFGNFWPGLRFGEMIFSRGAKIVSCHPSHGITAGVADKSVMYFTNYRLNRPTSDLSDGWGSNSRWRTNFYRNYQVDGLDLYNVDGIVDLASNPRKLRIEDELSLGDLSVDEEREALMHRCFVHTQKTDEYWPYSWRLAVKNTGATWPLENKMVVEFDEALRQVGVVKPGMPWE